MSVPKSKRKPNTELTAITKAVELEEYTIHIMSNPKYFPEEFRNTLTDEIISLSISIVDNLVKANSIRVSSDADYKVRRQFQQHAIGAILSMDAQLMVAKKVFKLKNQRYLFWTGLLSDVRNLTYAWKLNDQNRYSKLKGGKTTEPEESIVSSSPFKTLQDYKK